MTTDDLLDIKQAAAFLNVSVTSLRRWTNAAELASLRVGGRRERRFLRADLLAFLEHRPATDRVVDQVASEASAAPAPALGPASHGEQGVPLAFGTHLCGLYGSDSGRSALAASFLLDGLREGSHCHLIAARAIRDEIVSYLEERRPSVRADISAGRLVLTQYAANGDKQLRFFEKELEKAVRAGVQAFRVVGDLRALAKRTSPAGVAEYEANYERRIAHRFPVVTLCQYDAREFSGVDVLNALKGHADTMRYRPDLVLA